MTGPPLDADELAIRDVLEGRTDAFRHLVESYKDSVFNLCCRLTGNSADAEDLSQEAFLQAFAKLRQFRRGSRFHPWLYTIALNLCRNHLRRPVLWRMLPFTKDAEGKEATPDQPEPGPTPEEALLHGEGEKRLHAAVDGLPGKYREVFLLRHGEDLSYEEIAQVTGLPIGTVEVRLFRARRLLAERLGVKKTK